MAVELGHSETLPVIPEVQNARSKLVQPDIFNKKSFVTDEGKRYDIEGKITKIGKNRSIVLLGRSPTGLLYALKVGRSLDPEEHLRARRSAEYQADAADRLSTQVAPIESFGIFEAPYFSEQNDKKRHHPNGSFTLTVLPYLRYGTLTDKISTPPPYMSEDIFRNNILFTLGIALDDIGGTYIHRDVKHPNVLMDVRNGLPQAFLTDFDIAVKRGVPIDQSEALSCTIATSSPEQAQYKTVYYTPQADFFGLAGGAALPFHDGEYLFFDLEDWLNLGSQERYKKYLQWRLGGMGSNMREVFEWGLAWNPTDRPGTALEFTEALRRAWERRTAPTVIYQAGNSSIHGGEEPDEKYKMPVQEFIKRTRQRQNLVSDHMSRTGDIISSQR